MRRRKLLIGLMSAGAFTAGFGAAVFPASAQLRTITVTLLGGETVTVQVDEPADGSATGTDRRPPSPRPRPASRPTRRRPRPRTPGTSSAVRRRRRPTRHERPPRRRPTRPRRRARRRRAPAPASTTATTPTPSRPRRQRALGLGRRPAGPGDGRQGAAQEGDRRGRGVQEGQGRGQARRHARSARATASRRPANPTFSQALPGRRADRRPELLHRQVPDPAVPAADLPGRRHRVRHPLGGPGRHQRDRDRLRPQPQRLLRRRAGLDAVHARPRGSSTASTPTTTARRTPSTPSTRSSPPRAT